MKKCLKVGVSGSGFIAITDYYPAFQRDDIREFIEVTGIFDVVPGRAEEHCKKFGLGQPFSDYDKMLSEADIDLMIILSPIPFHFDQVKKALLANKHVYVQKTMTVTSEEAIELCQIAKEKNLLLCAAPGQMALSAHIEAKRLLDTGKFGKICWARGMGGHPGHENQYLFGIDPSWYYKPGGGPMGDVAVYPITSITGLLGPAKRVTGFSGIAVKDRYWEGKKLDVEMDDNTYLLLEFADNVFASITGNFCTPQFRLGPQVELYGTKGIINLGGWNKPSVPIEYYTQEPMFGNKNGWYKPADDMGAKPGPANWHTINDVVHIADCIIEGKKSLMGGEHAAHVIEIIEKGYVSARTGQAQELKTIF